MALVCELQGRVRAGTRFATLDEVKDIASRLGVTSRGGSPELRLALRYLAEVGHITWFDEPGLDHIVVLVSLIIGC